MLDFELAFRDVRGVLWARRGSGVLDEISKDPLEFYGISLPRLWGGCGEIGRRRAVCSIGQRRL